METLYKVLTYALYGVAAVFAWDALSCVVDYLSNPVRYEAMSAPWYTGILISGVFALVLSALIWLVRKMVKKRLES